MVLTLKTESCQEQELVSTATFGTRGNSSHVPLVSENEASDTSGRRVHLQEGRATVQPQLPKSAAPNAVRTARFTLMSWLPKSLYMQFLRVANIYFVIVAVLTLTPLWGRPSGTKVLTVTALLMIQALKDLYEDTKRWRDDRILNEQPVLVYDHSTQEYREVKWQACSVGDIVLIKKGEALPADVLTAATPAGSGICFVSTKSLDGETHLKERQAPALLRSILEGVASPEEAASRLMQGLEIRLELPHPSLLQIDCTVAKSCMPSGACIDNFLLRGCILENTAWLVGIVCYVGDDTKVRMNSSAVPSKRSELEGFLNCCVMIILVLIFATSLLFAVLESVVAGAEHIRFARVFVSYVVTLYVVLPMSLYVMFEAMHIAIGQQIERDRQITDQDSGRCTRARNTSVLEEMGQVEYVFSDKTGTLTANEMRFASCFIGDRVIGPFLPTATGEPPPGVQEVLQVMPRPEGKPTEAFFEALALCNTVRVDDDGAYLGESPDDVALVQAARAVGVVLCARHSDGPMEALMLEKWQCVKEKRSVACVIPFSSDRKRMSVMCPMDTGGAVVLTKGADSVMEERLDAHLPEGARSALSHFARLGLRTLVVARREMDREAYAAWSAQWAEASTAMGEARAHLLEAVAAVIEQGLSLIGISALEDRLQEGVPRTISALRSAGIRVWVLTGDKVETAVEIARACSLFEESMPLTYVTGARSSQEALASIKLSSRATADARHSSFRSSVISSFLMGAASADAVRARGIVIDGASVQHVLTSGPAREMLFELAQQCSSCVCCRLSPMQKRELVELVRELSGRAVTLAIGDGANDVPMIQGAHIGIGIRGKEGSGAVQACDVAITQFSFLGKLVLFYGRTSYQRLAVFLCFFMYKSVVIGCSYLLYAGSVYFSGLLAYPQCLDMVYNPVSSAAIVLALLSNDDAGRAGSASEAAMWFPSLYKVGPNRGHLNVRVYTKWTLFAVLHGVLAWEVPALMLPEGHSLADQDAEFWKVSYTSFTIVVLVIHFKILLVAGRPIKCGTLALVLAELLLYALASAVLGSGPVCKEMHGVPQAAFASWQHVLLLVSVTVGALLGDMLTAACS